MAKYVVLKIKDNISDDSILKLSKITGIEILPNTVVGHPWGIQDVISKYDCSRKEAIEILETVLNSNSVVSEIHSAIEDEAEDRCLEFVSKDED